MSTNYRFFYENIFVSSLVISFSLDLSFLVRITDVLKSIICWFKGYKGVIRTGFSYSYFRLIPILIEIKGVYAVLAALIHAPTDAYKKAFPFIRSAMLSY